MANKMLIDASHPEETRVVVLRGNRVEEFDFESAHRKQLRGNIYLAKVTRVEPSLQAAFVDYGGNRHGFLAFSEIHPDYYQIPVADRQALIAEEERAQRDADAEAEHRSSSRRRSGRYRSSGRRDQAKRSEHVSGEERSPEASGLVQGDVPDAFAGSPATETGYHDTSTDSQDADRDSAYREESAPTGEFGAAQSHPDEQHRNEAQFDEPQRDEQHPDEPQRDAASHHGDSSPPFDTSDDATASPPFEQSRTEESVGADRMMTAGAGEMPTESSESLSQASEERGDRGNGDHGNGDQENGDIGAYDRDNGSSANGDNGNGDNGSSEDAESEEDIVESVGGSDALEEVQERVARPRSRQYKIQEVIKRRQVMLVQVVKEERGTKGAALTTYLSLAGRYSVLMPNTSRGGGISRKITSADDRRRLKDIAQDLEVPEGMGVILRTAGASRTKIEVKRDFEYLLRLWETVRDLTLKSTAPKLVYEEGSLVKRSIRDLYNKDIDDIIVSGDEGYREAKDFMRMLMPSHAKNVKQYKDHQPLLTRFGIESQLDAMFSPIVQLRSGGYIVINQTEALVAIDVNSGRATREHHIEDTALKTNCEAAEEVARQLRLRDLAGLIVIDFIDMDEKRNNRTVERKVKDALKHDRARIQVGPISHFGLLEMSRQRIRSSVLESTTEKCPECGGTGHIRSVSSVSLQLLRGLEETLIKSATHSLIVRTKSNVALYVLNHKRAHLRALEERFKLTISVNADDSVTGPLPFTIDRGEQVHTPEAAKALVVQPDSIMPEVDDDEVEIEAEVETEAPEPQAAEAAPAEREQQPHAEGEENGTRRRRRRRRRGRGSSEPREGTPAGAHPAGPSEAMSPEGESDEGDEGEDSEDVAESGAFVPATDDQPHPAEAGFSNGAANGAGGTKGESNGESGRRRRGRRGRRGRGGGSREGGHEDEYRQDRPEHAAGPESYEVGATSDQVSESSPGAPAGDSAHPPVEQFEVRPMAVDAESPMPRSFGGEPAAPMPTQAPPSVMVPAAAPEPPRRRSTIREPAPVFGEQGTAPVPSPQPAPPPPPAMPEAEANVATSADDGKPRRSGWWSRRG